MTPNGLIGQGSGSNQPDAVADAQRRTGVVGRRGREDVAPVLAHFTQYGFLQRTYDGVPIFSHAQDPGAPWFDPATGLVDVTGSLQAQNEFNDWLDNNGAAGLARVANKDVNTGYEQTAKSWNLK